jgi:hypothetical protein
MGTSDGIHFAALETDNGSWHYFLPHINADLSGERKQREAST